MNNLYEIIMALQNASGSNAKKAILEANKDNELLEAYLKAVFDPRINFYITAKTLPVFEEPDKSAGSIDILFIEDCISVFAKREVTGNAAKGRIQDWASDLSSEGQELFKMLLLKDIKANIGATIANKVWPGLIFEQPYMRCSLPKAVKLQDWPWNYGVYSQEKADGMYVAASCFDGIVRIGTRNGSVFPSGCFPSLEGYISTYLPDMELNGELLVANLDKPDGETLLSRKEGNGILNSVLQGGELPHNHQAVYVVWDYQDETISYEVRFAKLSEALQMRVFAPTPEVFLIKSRIVHSQQEAVAHMQECLADGKEGTVIKHPDGPWMDGTSKRCVKYKIEAEIDLEIYDIVEGQGKASGMMGALRLQSSCGKLKVDCGSGFSDEQRKAFWQSKQGCIGQTITVKANDILDKRGSDTMSLFLPIFIELRLDKSEADSLERIQEIFDSAKGLK